MRIWHCIKARSYFLLGIGITYFIKKSIILQGEIICWSLLQLKESRKIKHFPNSNCSTCTLTRSYLMNVISFFLFIFAKVYSKEVQTHVRPVVPDLAPRHVQRYVAHLHHHLHYHHFHHHHPHRRLPHQVPLALMVLWVWLALPVPMVLKDPQDLPDFPAHPVSLDSPVPLLDPQDVMAPWDHLDHLDTK